VACMAEEIDSAGEQRARAMITVAGNPVLSTPNGERLTKALEQLDWVKRNRKVFFMPAWINAFVNGHSSKEALEIVRAFMKNNPDLSLDIRRKLLQSLDGLERAVKIKERWK